MTEEKKLKIPCAVFTAKLSDPQLELLNDKFCKLGVKYAEEFFDHYTFAGVDYNNTTRRWDHLGSFSENEDGDDVTIYSYEDIINWDSVKASTEALQDVSEEKATNVPELAQNAFNDNTGGMEGISVVRTSTYQLKIKGYDIILTEKEIDELYSALESAE